MTAAGRPRLKDAIPSDRRDRMFVGAMAVPGSVYALLLGGVLVAMLGFTTPAHLRGALASPEIRHAVQLSLFSSTASALLSLLVAIPLGYLLSRASFPGKAALEALIDVPIVLPPLVIGLGLLIFFQTRIGRAIDHVVPVTFAVPAVILAQFAIACAFAIRTMRVAFDQIDPRAEQVALTLGCGRASAFLRVVLPQAARGAVTAASLAWARALGEFGPVLIFAGATRMRTEVLPTTIFLEMSVGRIEAAVAVSLIMLAAATLILLLARTFGLRDVLS